MGQLLPQHASWWHSAWRRDRPEATFLEEGLAVNATPLCGHVTNMELEAGGGSIFHLDQLGIFSGFFPTMPLFD